MKVVRVSHCKCQLHTPSSGSLKHHVQKCSEILSGLKRKVLPSASNVCHRCRNERYREPCHMFDIEGRSGGQILIVLQKLFHCQHHYHSLLTSSTHPLHLIIPGIQNQNFHSFLCHGKVSIEMSHKESPGLTFCSSTRGSLEAPLGDLLLTLPIHPLQDRSAQRTR